MSNNFSVNVESGLKILAFKEVGKEDICIQALLESKNLVVVDKHVYNYATVAQKDFDTSSLKGCVEINLNVNDSLSTSGLHYPIFVSRPQEFKKFDIIWT